MYVGMPSVYPVTCHTDQVGPGSTFVVIKGFSQNGSAFIAQAIERGATCIVIDYEEQLSPALVEQLVKKQVVIERVAHTRQALALLSAQAAGHPACKLNIIGITGTKGKTTTAYLLAHLLRASGYSVALMSTAENMIGSQRFSTPLTTPQPDYLHQFLKSCVHAGVRWVVMEVAAQAISLHRIEGIAFDAIIMTNIAREHLEFYSSMESYIEAKMSLMTYVKQNAPIWVNGDESHFAHLVGVHRFGIRGAHLELRGQLKPTETLFFEASIMHQGNTYSFSSDALCGEYNLYNVLAACAGAMQVGLSGQEIQRGLATFQGVPGRLERYRLPGGGQLIIDYAHNPSSYHALLSMLRPYAQSLIVVFGAGGDRDQGRRPEMGAIAAQYADILFVTTDNPRTEDPREIIDQIVAGIPREKRERVHCILDRAEAIFEACRYDKEGTIIALLGKGREEYQLIRGVKIPCSEREIIRSFYRSRGSKQPF